MQFALARRTVSGPLLDYRSVDIYTIEHFRARMVYAIQNEAAGFGFGRRR
jgi:hypothetical protein